MQGCLPIDNEIGNNVYMKSLERLKQLLPANIITTNPYELDAAARDESGMKAVRPMAVVRPVDEDQCVAVVRACMDTKTALVPRGAGTGLEGAAIPSEKSIVMDFTGMNKVLKTSVEDHFVLVEPGVIYDDLNNRLRDTGLFFPPSPGGSSDTATIGGMVATNASGIYAYRYGGTGRWVRSLRVVTGRGEVLYLGTRAPKSSTGYALHNLFVGSEGTLGVITRVGMELAPVPESRIRQAFVFDTLDQAVSAAVEMAWAVPELAAIELMDKNTTAMVRRFLNIDLKDGTGLFIEFHAAYSVRPESVELANQVAASYKGKKINVDDPWRIRHFGTRAVTAGQNIVRIDAGVPLSALSEYMNWAISYAAPKSVYAFGHVGIGIVHLLMPFDPDDDSDTMTALDFKKEAALKAVSLGGTVSGEHGIGLGNRDFAIKQYKNTLDYMKGIKKVFDPKGIMNPGKVI